MFVYFFLVTLSLKLHCTRILAKHLLQYFLFPSNTQQLIQAREEEQKLSLAKTCKLFHNWPLLSLKKISGLVKWRRFSPGQGSLSRWREETHIVSLFYIKFHIFSSIFFVASFALVDFSWDLTYNVGGKLLLCSHLRTSLASSTRNIFQHFASGLILVVFLIPLIFFSFCSSCQWRWAMWSDWLHKERRMSSSTLH